MISNISAFYKVLLFVSAAAFCYFGYIGSPLITFFYPLLYGLGLGFHLLFDNKKSQLFITVFSLFIISSLFQVYFYFVRLDGAHGAFQYLYTVQLFWILGFILIFLKMIKDQPLRSRWTKWSFLVPVVLLVDVFLGYKIIQMIEVFNLSSHHIVYTFSYTILKMVLMSVGLIFFFSSNGGSTRISFLTGSFICFFLTDIIGAFNSLFFFNDLVAGLVVLEVGFLCIALMFFYIYCTSANLVNALEEEQLI